MHIVYHNILKIRFEILRFKKGGLEMEIHYIK